ncbi:HEAT repeat domain-containing protein [bacterium]|nr:HEAT repeat domain-containing protein [bacterium]
MNSRTAIVRAVSALAIAAALLIACAERPPEKPAAPTFAGATVEEWRDRLSGPDAAVAAEKLRTPDAVPVLVAAGLRADPEVAMETERIILALGEPAAQPLAKEAASTDHNRSARAIYLLSRMGDSACGAVPQLVELIRRGHQQSKKPIAVNPEPALTDIGPCAAPDLVPLLADEELRESAIDVLEHYGVQAVPALLAIGEFADEEHRDVVRGLESSLRMELRLPDLRTAAAIRVEGIDPEHDVLRGIVEDEDDLELLGIEDMPATSAVTRLRNHLASSDPVRRRLAARTLAKFGPLAQPALPELESLLDTDDMHLRWAVISALGEIGEPAADTAPRLAELYDQSTNIESRRRTAWALGRIGWASRDAVGDLGETALDTSASTPLRIDTIFALARIDPGGQQDLLASLLSDTRWPIRRTAAEALVITGPIAIGTLQHSLESDDPRTRRMAAIGLLKLGTKYPFAQDVLAQSAPDDDEFVAWAQSIALQTD